MFGLTLRKLLLMHPDIFNRRLLLPLHSLPPLTPPSPREIHFWYVIPDEVIDDSLMNQYVQLLSPCERKTILQMKKDKVQKVAVLTRTLVRTTIARYTKCEVSPSSLKFRKTRFGKPEVDWKQYDTLPLPSLQFNISHSSSLVACGVTMEVPIGIDVEEKQRKLRNNISSFARRYFSLSEVEYLHTLTDPESQREELIKLWTLKEAYVKALGRGFSAAPFRDFTIRFEACEREQFLNSSEMVSKIVVDASDTSGDLTSNWQFGLFELNGSHYAAVCVERREEDSDFNTLKLKVWRTLPLIEDECVSGKNTVRIISSLS